jgi:hypothetical protein
MRTKIFKDNIMSQAIIRVIILLLSMTPLLARADVAIRFAEVKGGNVEIRLAGGEGDSLCLEKAGQMFETRLDSKKVSTHVYAQRLNSEVSEDAVYLKAAGMGKGIYMYLPYFIPKADCSNVDFNIEAKHILWNGEWHAGNVKISATAARRKAIFFTNEEAPVIKGATYFDSEIPKDVLDKMEFSFGKIVEFYQDVLAATPMRGIGVVAALTRNEGKYTGFGGDSLNIIRMSYDNPKPEDILTLNRILPGTFAHELAHKLQTEKLFDLPPARYIVEGGADFLKVIVLLNAGIIDEERAKEVVLQAGTECGKFSDARTLSEKIQQKAFNYREPYDCGMLYYFTAYYSSNLPLWDFIDAFRKAMSGEKIYTAQVNSLCLLFEPTCGNERLNGVAGHKNSYLQQVAWLKSKLVAHSLILAKRSKGGSPD